MSAKSRQEILEQARQRYQRRGRQARGRLEGEQAARLLNELYTQEWGMFRNFFCPVMKHLRTEVKGSAKRRVYDQPATSFERLKACAQVDAVRLAELQEIFARLDPFALKGEDRKEAAGDPAPGGSAGQWTRRRKLAASRLTHKAVALA